MKVLVTGAAGFIGMHTCQHLLARGDSVVGVDSLNAYYDVQLKRNRLDQLKPHAAFSFHPLDLCDGVSLNSLFRDHAFDRVIHLAAQAGVRYSLVNPQAYLDSNIVAFTNVLEACRHHRTPHLVYASSSSVYGGNRQLPFATSHSVVHPVSLYAATKKANELFAHTYSHLFGLPTTGLRFFTVYGPWGRPDMAMWLFTKAILAGQPIDVFNHGNMERDFTYVDDIVESVVRVADRIPAPQPKLAEGAPGPAESWAPYRVYNIGNSQPEPLLKMIGCLESALGMTAEKRLLPMQPGDVPATFADVDDLFRDFQFQPSTSLEDGTRRFVDWYRAYHRV